MQVRGPQVRLHCPTPQTELRYAGACQVLGQNYLLWGHPGPPGPAWAEPAGRWLTRLLAKSFKTGQGHGCVVLVL